MGWPQWCILGIYAIKLLALAHLHGRFARYDFGSMVVDYGIIIWLLWMGGFFS